jgi:hypothetical protein
MKKDMRLNTNRRNQMLIPTIIMGMLAIGLFLIGYFNEKGQHITGLIVQIYFTQII